MSKSKIVKTACGICGPCCQADAYVKDGKIISVEGSRNVKGQTGSLCAKGMAAKQFVYNKDRVLYPMKRTGKKGEGTFARITWDEAYDLIAENLLKVRDTYGARSTVFYAGYPKWYRPALLRLANAYGSPNYCTESSTCFQAADLAWRSTYGNHICGPDMLHARTVMLWSSNLYHSNTPMSRMYQGLKERGTKIIDVDSRHTVTAHDAHIHLKPVPGSDGALALSMAHVIIEEGLYDRAFVERYVYGFEEYRDYVRRFTPEKAEGITGVSADQIRRAARLFAQNSPSCILFSASPIVHHTNGVQNYRAVFSLLAITGNYDVEGGNCPKAGITSPCIEFGKVKRYDREEAIGQREFPVWFDLSCEEAQCTRLADYIVKEEPYPIKAVFGMGLNHRMWPQPGYLNEALQKLDFYVNVELFLSDSCMAADLVLPACTSYEREEVHGLKGGRYFFSNKAIEPLGESKNDIEIIMEVLKRMGLHDEVLELGYDGYMQHILEPSGLSLNELKRNEEGMQGRNLDMPSFQNFEKEKFQTPSGKIELKSLVLERYRDSHGYDGLPVFHDFRKEAEVDREAYPFILNTGCRKPQYFHARVYRVPWLDSLQSSPLIELHPEDASTYGIADGDVVKISSPAGTVTGTAAYNISGGTGVVYMYHGDSRGDANELIDKDYLDPISGFPGYKSYFCKVEKVEDMKR